MIARYITGKNGISQSNIIWAGKFPMRAGKFPKDHPCIENPKPMVFGPTPPSGGDCLSEFRRHFPDASCFPEGDGICFTQGAVAPSMTPTIIRECFWFEVYASLP